MRATLKAPIHQLAGLTLQDPADVTAERDLIERARLGDGDAFGVLVRTHLPAAIRVAMRVVRSADDAEDVVQDAFLSALRRIDSFDTNRRFWPWLCRIVVNRALDLVNSRAVRHARELTPDVPDASPSAHDIAQESELMRRARQVMATMPPRQRLVMELFDLEGASVVDIAEVTGTAPATVRWHLHMGHKLLRKALAPFYGDNR